MVRKSPKVMISWSGIGLEPRDLAGQPGASLIMSLMLLEWQELCAAMERRPICAQRARENQGDGPWATCNFVCSLENHRMQLGKSHEW